VSQAKRVRKARMKARQSREAKRLGAVFMRHHGFLVEQRERAQFRRELNASDMPDAVKTLVGALVDPVGFVHDIFVKEMGRRKETVDRDSEIGETDRE
jgi:hypothetical protein